MVSWQYDAPYDTYSCAPGELESSVQWVLKPQYQYYTVWDENQELIGFRCFGEDAQVNGGDYSSDALDMGGGLRPDWAGSRLVQVHQNSCRFFERVAYDDNYGGHTISNSVPNPRTFYFIILIHKKVFN